MSAGASDKAMPQNLCGVFNGFGNDKSLAPPIFGRHLSLKRAIFRSALRFGLDGRQSGSWATSADSDERGHGLKRSCEQPPRARIIGRTIAPTARMMLPYPAAVQKKTFLDDR
jgi:hypothetical protein